MEKCFVVLDHERMVPPFMISILKYASNHYEKVYYINTHKPDIINLFADTYIEIIYSDSFSRFKNSVIAFFRFFSLENLRQWFFCIKKEGVNFGYTINLLKYLAADEVLSNYTEKIIETNKGASVVVLATWFAAAAFAAAELKKKYPEIKAVSLAHSYEILPIRNRFIPYFYVNKKHKYLDGVFFIASTVREMYLEGIGGLPEEYYKKTHVKYLGSYKNHDVLNKINPEEFHICTCSRMVSLKRLDILMDALSLWNSGDIYWSHLGGGDLESFLKEKSIQVMERNPLVHISFEGYLRNEDVMKYYESRPVYLFINISSIEGLPVSIMEAISYGIPVMATDVGGTNEIINRKSGFLINPAITPEYIKDQLLFFKNLPEEEKQELRKNAYQQWKETFDAENNLKSLFSAIENS